MPPFSPASPCRAGIDHETRRRRGRRAAAPQRGRARGERDVVRRLPRRQERGGRPARRLGRLGRLGRRPGLPGFSTRAGVREGKTLALFKCANRATRSVVRVVPVMRSHCGPRAPPPRDPTSDGYLAAAAATVLCRRGRRRCKPPTRRRHSGGGRRRCKPPTRRADREEYKEARRVGSCP